MLDHRATRGGGVDPLRRDEGEQSWLETGEERRVAEGRILTQKHLARVVGDAVVKDLVVATGELQAEGIR